MNTQILNREEVIHDFCSQIADRLRRDCNLRESDSYIYGYSGTATIHLDLFGMDRVAVELATLLTSGEASRERSGSIDSNMKLDDTAVSAKKRLRYYTPRQRKASK
jgi:hypothetical protein